MTMHTPEQVVEQIHQALKMRDAGELLVLCTDELDVVDLRHRLKDTGVEVLQMHFPNVRYLVAIKHVLAPTEPENDEIYVEGSSLKELYRLRNRAIYYGLCPTEVRGSFGLNSCFSVGPNECEEGTKEHVLSAELRRRYLDWLKEEQTTCWWHLLAKHHYASHRPDRGNMPGV